MDRPRAPFFTFFFTSFIVWETQPIGSALSPVNVALRNSYGSDETSDLFQYEKMTPSAGVIHVQTQTAMPLAFKDTASMSNPPTRAMVFTS